MILWTIQPAEVVNILEQEKRFVCNPKLSENMPELQDAYAWMVKQMDVRGIPHPEGLELPLWAYHTRHGKHKKPDLREKAYATPGQSCVCIEFEIPDEQVLLSDLDNWHFVLNNSWFDDSNNEEEWEELHRWFDGLDPQEQDRIKNESWQKVFDITPIDTEWMSQGMYIQATFWELRKDMVRKIQYFKAR